MVRLLRERRALPCSCHLLALVGINIRPGSYSLCCALLCSTRLEQATFFAHCLPFVHASYLPLVRPSLVVPKTSYLDAGLVPPLSPELCVGVT
jgi:hypothetical protein